MSENDWIDGWICRCGDRYAWFQLECPNCNQRRYPRPKPGMGATLILWSDRHAYTIEKVSASGKTLWMREDIATLEPSFKPDMVAGGFSAHCQNNSDQKYTYKPNTKGDEVRVTLTRKGWHCRKGYVIVGKRDEFYDYNF